MARDVKNLSNVNENFPNALPYSIFISIFSNEKSSVGKKKWEKRYAN